MSDNNGSPKPERHRAVLVVGAGIGGMQSALLLAEAGYHVYLLDSAPGIGGSMHLLDRTFPTNSCGLCLMLPGRASYCPTIECDLHRNIDILPNAEVRDVAGDPGAFTVTVRRKPRYVDVELCTNCGLCVEVCPIERPHQYEGDGLAPDAVAKRKAIYQPPVRAIPPAYVIDMDYCTRCGDCVPVCPTDAIDLEMAEREEQIEVGAVVLSPGYEPFEAGIKGEYGFGHYDNVLSSIQFERMVSLSGSTGADIVRPSDGATPQRIAFIQCVGSRDPSIDRGYCSSVCCMYTAKQVQVAKELRPDLDATVFFMDIRAHGKDFDEYFDQVEAMPGVNYRRAMVSSIHEYKQTGDLQLNFVAEDGTVQEEDFDMVVLSVGFAPPESFQDLGRALGVDLNRYGFCVTETFHPGESSQRGILVSGAFREPKDIPETVVEASAVAASAARLVGQGASRRVASSSPHNDVGEHEERDISLEWPRVGVFLCDCRGEVGAVVDLQELSEFAEGLRDVVLVQTMDNACLMSGREQIAEAIEEMDLNRVVIAGCPAREYQSAFEGVMRGAGLNPGLMERVNLRGEVAWVHQGNGKDAGRPEALAKAKELVGMAVAGVRMDQPARFQEQELSQRALVIGGGVAGMTAALNLGQMGHEVDLVERSGELGGQLRNLRYTLTGEDPVAFLNGMIGDVESNDLIHVYREAEVEAVDGWVGQYQTSVALANGEKRVLSHGAIVVATGGDEVTPTEYLYGEDRRVVTQRELEEMLDAGEDGPAGFPSTGLRTDDKLTTGNVVMIQCVGSREPERPYCSRVCCTKAVANALRINEQFPQARVFVLYREMRTYGFREDLYREAREKGVTFLRYELPDKPRVTEDDGALTIRLQEPVTGQDLEIPAELLVLSTGIESNDARQVAGALEVPLDENGFFQEEYPKMRPLDFTKRGIFVCGLAHSPRFSDEAIVQAEGAAMRAAALLAQQELEAPVAPVQVSERLCTACGQCVEVCPYGARVLEPGAHTAEVIEVLCQGCGACIVACPNKATRRQGAEVPSVYRMLESVV
ncbi:MAG: FAD-dependent oxidoreductase [Anaerolineae bacterium]